MLAAVVFMGNPQRALAGIFSPTKCQPVTREKTLADGRTLRTVSGSNEKQLLAAAGAMEMPEGDELAALLADTGALFV